MKTMLPDREQLANAFAEWERNWRENPSEYTDEQTRLSLECTTYGELAAAYFTKLLEAEVLYSVFGKDPLV